MVQAHIEDYFSVLASAVGGSLTTVGNKDKLGDRRAHTQKQRCNNHYHRSVRENQISEVQTAHAQRRCILIATKYFNAINRARRDWSAHMKRVSERKEERIGADNVSSQTIREMDGALHRVIVAQRDLKDRCAAVSKQFGLTLLVPRVGQLLTGEGARPISTEMPNIRAARCIEMATQRLEFLTAIYEIDERELAIGRNLKILSMDADLLMEMARSQELLRDLRTTADIEEWQDQWQNSFLPGEHEVNSESDVRYNDRNGPSVLDTPGFMVNAFNRGTVEVGTRMAEMGICVARQMAITEFFDSPQHT